MKYLIVFIFFFTVPFASMAQVDAYLDLQHSRYLRSVDEAFTHVKHLDKKLNDIIVLILKEYGHSEKDLFHKYALPNPEISLEAQIREHRNTAAILERNLDNSIAIYEVMKLGERDARRMNFTAFLAYRKLYDDDADSVERDTFLSENTSTYELIIESAVELQTYYLIGFHKYALDFSNYVKIKSIKDLEQ